MDASMTTTLRFTSCIRLTVAGALCSLTLSGCLSPITLTRAVTTYDEAVTEAVSKQLLINIARASLFDTPLMFATLVQIAILGLTSYGLVTVAARLSSRLIQ